ncbi:MAG: hypothetical protein ACXV7I_08270 [Ilumatobacteraceae bacterium]
MSAEMRPEVAELFRRRRAMFVAMVLSLLGVIALASRESTPHPGRGSSLGLLFIGILVYVVPFVFVVDRSMRRGSTRMAAVVVVGAVGAIFLATRALGSFSQVWPLFTMIVSLIAMQVISQFIRAGVIPGRTIGEERSTRYSS